MGLLRVDHATRQLYLKAIPLAMKICQARRERRESKLRFSVHDLLYLKTVFTSKITLDTTFRSIKNTPAPAMPFKTIARLAFHSEVLAALNDRPRDLKNFMATFPALEVLTILTGHLPAQDGVVKYGAGGYHGLHPNPKDTHLENADHWNSQVEVLLNLMKEVPAVLAGEANLPKITFI